MKKTYDELLDENKALQSKIESLTKFIYKEIAGASFRLKNDTTIKESRKKFDNLFESDVIFSLREQFQKDFPGANTSVIDRFIDGELLWMFMQKYSRLDGIAISIVYQKILDEWIESVIISGWRKSVEEYIYIEQSPLEKDLFRLISEKHTLSFGRFYALVEYFRSSLPKVGLVLSIETYLQKNLPEIYEIIISDIFFQNTEKLVQMEIFGKKRHAYKISYIEVKSLRKILLEKPEGLFYKIFATETK